MELFLSTTKQTVLSNAFFHGFIAWGSVPLTDMTPPTIITSSTTSTRSDINNLSVPFARTDTYKFSFGPHACNIWNNLPSHIKEVTSIDTFKKLINNL